MQFLNPRTDLAFKKIFGSNQSEDILLSFLNAVLTLAHPIVHVTIVDPYQAPRLVGMKESFVDVRAVDETGRQFIIEMQVLNVHGFEKGVLYNACKAYAGQIDVGQNYPQLADVIALTITDFVMFPERTHWRSTFRLKADDGQLYGDDLELVFIELPKFKGQEADLGRMGILEKWLFFLRHAREVQLIPESLQEVPPIAHAFAIANRASLSRLEDDEQTRRELYIDTFKAGQRMREEAEAIFAEHAALLAERAALQAESAALQAESAVLRESVGQAVAESHAQGTRQAALTIARSLLPLLADNAAIAAATGLTAADVVALRNS
jgi:predicted transposase/invertase (TIGR01784 family)